MGLSAYCISKELYVINAEVSIYGGGLYFAYDNGCLGVQPDSWAAYILITFASHTQTLTYTMHSQIDGDSRDYWRSDNLADEENWQANCPVPGRQVSGELILLGIRDAHPLAHTHVCMFQAILDGLNENRNMVIRQLEGNIQAVKDLETKLESRHEAFEILKVMFAGYVKPNNYKCFIDVISHSPSPLPPSPLPFPSLSLPLFSSLLSLPISLFPSLPSFWLPLGEQCNAVGGGISSQTS